MLVLVGFHFKIYFEIGPERKGEREIFHPLVHSPDGSNDQFWARPKLRGFHCSPMIVIGD